MKYRINTLWIFMVLLCFIIYSCDEVIEDYDLPEADKMLVVNGLFHQDSLFSVRVSQSYPAYDKDPLRYIYVENANVDLYINNNYYETLSRVYEGKYRSNTHYPELNNIYKIVISADGFDTVNSTSTIPNPVNITIDSLYTIIKNQEEYLACDLIINDPPEKNYYYFKSYINPAYYRSRLSKYEDYNYWIEDNKIGHWTSEEEGIPEIFVFSDEFFNSENYKFTLYSSPLYYSQNHLKAYYSLYSITEDLYKYSKTLNNQHHTLNSNVTDITPVHNNIENGLGIFSGYSCKSDSFIFEGNDTADILYYGYAQYNNKEFGINEVKYYPDDKNGNFELSIGSITIYVDDNSNTLKGKGLNVSLQMISNYGYKIVVGTYEFNSTANNRIIAGEALINDHTEIIVPEPIEIISGNINIISYYYDSYSGRDIIELEYNFELINNEIISGNYEGPLNIINR